jgi:hypothetical protein
MNVALRHRCRNLHCRMKLKAPVENERHAFCCRGCFNSFYRSRCLVCEKDISLDPLTGERRDRSSRRKFCGRKCKAEAVKFPHTYQHPRKRRLVQEVPILRALKVPTNASSGRRMSSMPRCGAGASGNPQSAAAVWRSKGAAFDHAPWSRHSEIALNELGARRERAPCSSKGSCGAQRSRMVGR